MVKRSLLVGESARDRIRTYNQSSKVDSERVDLRF